MLLDERSSSDLQFPIWIYYSSLPAGGLLMTIRYIVRLYRYLFRFDPATMTVGHLPDHEMPMNVGTEAGALSVTAGGGLAGSVNHATKHNA
jgi:hypothetical protein